MWRGIWILEFNRRFTEKDMDRQLEEKLIGELSGIFNWALEGYNKLKEKKFALSESTSMKISKKEYRDDIDSVRAFVKDKLIKSNDTRDVIIFSETYEQYKSYCQLEGKKDVLVKTDFKKTLIDVGYEIKSSSRCNNKVCIFQAKLN
jgi:putative DNA primase/helicase